MVEKLGTGMKVLVLKYMKWTSKTLDSSGVFFFVTKARSNGNLPWIIKWRQGLSKNENSFLPRGIFSRLAREIRSGM
jgi:hypothetical protein